MIFGTLAVLVMIGVFVYINNKQDNDSTVSIQPARVYTEEEKFQILRDMSSSTPIDTPLQQAEKLRILKNLSKQLPEESASSTAAKLQLLQELAAKAGQ